MRKGSIGNSVNGNANRGRCAIRQGGQPRAYKDNSIGFRTVNGVYRSGWVSYAPSYHRVEYRRATNTVFSSGSGTLGFRCEWCR